MVLKFFRQKAVNPEPGGLDYLLRNPTARVIRGNPEITQALIDSSPPRMVQRFTAGVLNGCPPMMNSKKEQELIDELEIQLLTSRCRESVPWCVIAHGAEEKHFVIPNYDPVFQKVVLPYIHRIDRNGLRAWVEHYSLRHRLPVPNERLRVEPNFGHMQRAGEDVEFLRDIWKLVNRWVSHNMMETRDDLLPLLSGGGYKVRCEKHAGGDLEQPVVMGPRGNWLPLAGSIYYRPEFGKRPIAALTPLHPAFHSRTLALLHGKVEERLKFRAWHLIGRLFGRTEQERVNRGNAKRHLYHLVQEKLRSERRALRALPSVKLAHLIQVVDLQKAGVQPDILRKKPAGKSDVPESPVMPDVPPFVEIEPAHIRAGDDNEEPAQAAKTTTADDQKTPIISPNTGKGKRSKKGRRMQFSELDDMGLPLKSKKPLKAPATSKPHDVPDLPPEDDNPTSGTQAQG